MLQLNTLSSSSMLNLSNPRFSAHTPLYPRPSSSVVLFSLDSASRVPPPAPRAKKLTVKCRRSDYFDQSRFPSEAPDESPFSSNSPGRGGGGGGGGGAGRGDGTLPPRVFIGHSIYKGKAALTVEPRAPEFASLDSGAIKLSKEGYVLLQFAPASGIRQYDWSRKQVLSLSIAEIGTLITLGARDSCEFFHDPYKGRSEEGKVRKLLKIEPLPDGSGHFFNLSVQNKLLNVDENIYIPITRGEFAILVSALNFIVPYLLGWHAYANSRRPDDPSRLNNANARPSAAELEWSR